MNRSTTRRWAPTAVLTAAVAVCGAALSGCGTGQISQTATQASAVNGTSANVKNIALRNVHLQAVQRGDSLATGTTVPLIFLAANNSAETADKLLAVTSDVGEVKLTGDGVIPAAGAVVFGAGGGEPDAAAMGGAGAGEQAGQQDGSGTLSAEVTLAKPITNGLSYNFTFDFEKAGRATVSVPISAGD